MHNNTSYKVGYGKPPKSTQYRPGQSGNSKGRPKQDETLKGIAEKELKRKVTIMESGKQRKVSYKTAIMKRCIASAAQGNMRSLEFLSKILSQTGPIQAEQELTASEQEIWDMYFTSRATKDVQ